MVEITRRDQMIVLGDDEVRIEEGPVLKTEIATEELLHDDNTAPHYYAGMRPMTFVGPGWRPVEVQAEGRDALGNPIKLGEEMTYADWGGKVRPAETCFKVYKREPVDPTKERLANGDRNPHYVPPHVRAGALLVDDGTPPNRTHYEYIFELIGNRKTEEAAIALGERALAGKG